MTHPNKKGKYVAELRLPTYFYSGSEERDKLPNPKEFGVSNGYWILRPLEEPSESDGFAEFVLVIEFPHKTLKDAENHALEVGRKFGSIASGYAGHPFESPKINRIALTDIAGNLMSQSNYWYGNKSHMLTKFDQLEKYRFQKYLGNISEIDGNTRYRILSAIHWYGISVSAIDPSASFTAAWTGLECIGTVLDSRFHPNGPKAPCGVCCNKVGKNRDRKKAGIEHIFRIIANGTLPESVSNDLIKGFSACRAHKLRSDAVHGLEEDVETLAQQCSEYRRHLIHVLNAAILHTIDPSTSSWVTGHYEFHPSARFSLKSSQALSLEPYQGEWVGGIRFETEFSKPVKDVLYGLEFILELRIQKELTESMSISKEQFERDSDIYNSPDKEKTIVRGLYSWHDRPSEPPWTEISEDAGYSLQSL